MTTRVRLPDGSYVNVPTDDPQAAAAAARKHWDTKSTQGKPKTFLDKVDRAFTVASDLNDSFVDSVLPNWGDELRGVGRAARALVTGKPVGPAFREGQRSFRADQERLEREHPTARTAAQGAGIALGTALPAGRALKGASLGQKMAQGARVGAAYGAASGAGQGDGADVARRATNAAYGAANGAAVGLALPVGGRVATATGRWARTNIPGVDRAVSTLASVPRAILERRRGAPAPSAAVQQANRLAGHRMNQGTVANGLPYAGPQSTPQAIAAEVERRNAQGVPAMIGDVTQPMRELTEHASRGVGPGQQMVRDRLERRQAEQGQRVRQHVQETLTTTPDPVAFVEQSKRQAREAAAPLYREAYDKPMYVTPEIDGITRTPAFREAIPQAYRNIRNQIGPDGQPMDPQAMGFRYSEGVPVGPEGALPGFHLPERGYVSIGPELSTEGFDQVARAMSDSGRAASTVNPVTGRLESTTNSVHINNRARDLRRLMGEQNPAYEQAVTGFGDDMTQVNAFQQGSDVAKLTGHEINAQRQALPDVAHGTWSTGAGTAMADAASQYGAKYPTGNVARHVQQTIGDDVKQQALSEMTGNTGGIRNLQDRLESEHQAHLNYRGAYGNSSTAARQQLDQELGLMGSIPITMGEVKNRFLNYIASHAAPQFQRDVKERIAQIVTASDAQSVQDVLRAIEDQAARDRNFADMLHKSGIATTAAYGMNVQPVDPTQDP